LATLISAAQAWKILRMSDPAHWIDAAWLIFFGYWLVSGFRLNKMKRSEPSSQRFSRPALTIAILVLLYAAAYRWDILNGPFVPMVWWVPYFTAVLTWIGMAVAVWARYHLGRYWSASVALREGHRLIRSGPYERIRHPIYTGIVTMLAATVLAVDRYRALIAFGLILAGIIWKARKEEALLASEFGSEFEEHRRHTGFFLPRFS
jgi:protein-S-isoprenylcysteine O-methyltransferase Ste14